MTRSDRIVGVRDPKSGGASRDRTDDLRVANATLSQLSYGPVRLERSEAAGLDARPISIGGSGRS